MRSQDDKSAYRRAEDDLKKLLYETKRKYLNEMLPNAYHTKPCGFNLYMDYETTATPKDPHKEF